MDNLEAVTTGASAARQHARSLSDGRQIAYVEQVDSRNIWKVAFDPTEESLERARAITQGSRW